MGRKKNTIMRTAEWTVHTQLMPLDMTACPAHDRHMEETERG